MHKLFAQYLDDVGINAQLKEVTSDEYHASQAANATGKQQCWQRCQSHQ